LTLKGAISAGLQRPQRYTPSSVWFSQPSMLVMGPPVMRRLAYLSRRSSYTCTPDALLLHGALSGHGPRNQFLEPRLRPYLLYHSLSHVSSLSFPVLLSPSFSVRYLTIQLTVDSRTYLRNGRVIPFGAQVTLAGPRTITLCGTTYNSKRDGHCTFVYSTLLLTLYPF
jgi:hypothetical protein